MTITGKGAKLRARRVVELSDNAVEWLLTCQRKSIKQARKSWHRLRVNCGYKLVDWLSDTLRHTALSNHLAAHQNEGKTANWAGNSPNVLHKHHKGLIQVDNALAYWLVTPSNVDEQPVPKAA